MNLKWHKRVASCGLGERLTTTLRATVLPFEYRFEMLPWLASSLPQELCCLVSQLSANHPRWLMVSEASLFSSLAGQRACLRATSVAALAFGRGALDRFEVVGSGSALRSCSRAFSSLLGNSLQSRSASRLVAGASLSGSVSREAYVASRDSQGGWGSCSLRSALLAFWHRAQGRSWRGDRCPRPGRRKSSGKLVELGRVTRRLKRTRELSSAAVPCGRSWPRESVVPCMGAA